MNRLQNKTALITGGTSGIGEAIARRFAAEGATVIICGRNQIKGDTIVKDIVSDGGKAFFEYLDVTNKQSVIDLRNLYVSKYQKLDVLVNNAGILKTAPLEDIEEKDWLDVFDTNMNSLMRVTQAFIDLILESKGNIINDVSIDGLQSLTRGKASYAYNCSKAAGVKFTNLLALNYTPKGIRVNCLCPGVTETNLFTNRDFSRFVDAIPMGRVGKPEEIANAALFLASDEASYVSGCILTVDGGGISKVEKEFNYICNLHLSNNVNGGCIL